MQQPLAHQAFAADVHCVPPPFRTLAVRSDEASHAAVARAPYGHVHRVHTTVFDAVARARLAALGLARVEVATFTDIGHARTSLHELAALAAGTADLPAALTRALQRTGVLGDETAAYQRCLEARIDLLVSCGAGFHNDVAGHWPRCLFWLLVLDAADVEFVMPHARLHIGLSAGDLLVFDPAMAHGLCRPADHGRAEPASFEHGGPQRQVFLTGELPLSDAQWAARGAPWLPVEWHAQRAALDLRVASFDERSGAVQRPRALVDAMQRHAHHAAAAAG